MIIYFSNPTFAQRLPFPANAPNINSNRSEYCPPNLYSDYRNEICHNEDYSITAIQSKDD
jgi:hypothetical protein